MQYSYDKIVNLLHQTVRERELHNIIQTLDKIGLLSSGH